MSAHCDYTAVCTPGLGKDCARVGGRPGAGCLCACHPDGLEREKPEDWKPSPIHAEAIRTLEVLAEKHGLAACDPGGECYFPRCLADGCEGAESDDCDIPDADEGWRR